MTLSRIERAACDALWRLPASVSALVIVAGSLFAMAALASGIVAAIAIVVGR